MSALLRFYKRAKKAVHGALAATVPVLALALATDSPGGASLVPAEWVAIFGAALGIGTTVYAARNTPAP